MSLESITKNKNTISPIFIWFICLLIIPLLSWFINSVTELKIIQYQDAEWAQLEDIEPRIFTLMRTGNQAFGILDNKNRFWARKNGKWIQSPSPGERIDLFPPMPHLAINDKLYALDNNGKLFSLEETISIEEEIPAETPSLKSITEHQSKLWVLGFDNSIWYKELSTNSWKFHSNLDLSNDQYYKIISVDSDLFAIGFNILKLENDSWVKIIEDSNFFYHDLLGVKDGKMWLYDTSDFNRVLSTLSSSIEILKLNESPFLISIDLKTNELRSYYQKDFKNLFMNKKKLGTFLWGIYNNEFLFSIENNFVKVNSLEDTVHQEFKKIPDGFLHVKEALVLQDETIIASAIVDKGVLSKIANYLKEIIGLIIIIQFISFWIAVYFESKRKRNLRTHLKNHSNEHNKNQIKNNKSIPSSARNKLNLNELKTSYSKKLYSICLTIIKFTLLSLLYITVIFLLVELGYFFNLDENIHSLAVLTTIITLSILYSLSSHIIVSYALRRFDYELAFKKASFLSKFNLNGTEEIMCSIQMYKGDFDAGNKLFLASIAKFHKSLSGSYGEAIVSLLSAHARSKMWEGKFDEAKNILDKISTADNSYREYFVTCAELMLVTGKTQEARKIFDIAKKKNNISHIFIKEQKIRESGFEALLLAWEGKFDKATKSINKVLKLDKQKYGPESSHLLVRAGEIYRLANQHQNSDEYFRTAFTIDPEGYSGIIAKLLMEKRNVFIKDIGTLYQNSQTASREV
jgi:tetratricopeptide (TPR) repeat protein